MKNSIVLKVVSAAIFITLSFSPSRLLPSAAVTAAVVFMVGVVFMAAADSQVAGIMAADSGVAAVAITAADTAAGMVVMGVAMAVGTEATVAATADGTGATGAGEAVIGAIPATVTDGESASASAGDLTGDLATLMGMGMATARRGSRRIIHTVTPTRTVIPTRQPAM